MRSNRIYVDQRVAAGQTLSLDERAAHHTLNVLRLRAGTAVVVFNGEEAIEHEATITRADKRQVELKLGPARAAERESSLDIHLLQGLSRAERMDLTVQKAVELGVTSITPVKTERTVVKLDAAREQRRLAHWRQIVIHACEQSGRTRLPVMHPCISLTDALAKPRASCALVLSPAAQTPLAKAPYDEGAVEILIGPEGGLSALEADLANANGFLPVRLGPRVLRTETAAMTAIAVVQATWGDFA